MAHIHTDYGHHDMTVSGLIIRTGGDGQPRALLHQHKKLGVYMQYGGHVELHENLWQALIHELREESGYDMDQLQLLQPQLRFAPVNGHSEQHPVPMSINTHAFGGDPSHFHTDTAYVFITSEDPGHAIADGEAAIHRLFTAAEIRELTDAEIYPDIREAALFALETLLHEWQAVPTPEPARQQA